MAERQAGAKKNHSFVDFGGVNTQSVRQAIGDNQFAWLEDVMPIGYGNGKVVPGPSAALATLPGGDTAYSMTSGNISGVNYMFMFCASGAAYQINLSNNAITTIGVAGTFSASGVAMDQWKNERIVIVDPSKGYFDWNGTTLTSYAGTIFSVSIVSGGINYTSSPSVTPASGTATFTATIGVLVATLSAAGTGYVVGDVLTISGGTFNSPCTLTVSAIGASGAITGINLTTTGDYTSTTPTNPASVTGGHGSAATFTLNFGITKVVVVNPGGGYITSPILNISGGAGTGASLTANLSSSTSGTSIATYAGRVWIANGRTVVFSAPNSYQDFTTTSLGGSFIMSDATMLSQIYQLYAANNYLYIFGQSSINVISDVRIQASPALTVFSNANISPSIGSDMPYSVLSYYRTIMFGNEVGIYGLNGVTPVKDSDELDGMYPNVDLTQSISSGLATIYNILCACFLLKYNDPVTGTTRQILAIRFNKKWFFSSQVTTMKFIASSVVGGVPTLFGTDGNSIYQLFQQVTQPKMHMVKSKLWDMGSPLITKQVLKLGMESLSPTTQAVISVSIDTETSSQSVTFAASNVLTWTNNANQPIVWTNNLAQTITWTAAGYVLTRTDVSNVGNYIGLTVNSSSPGVTYSGFHLQYEPRTPWTGAPW